MRNLYLVHCGFYDRDISDGIFESHTNIFVAASSFEEARAKAKQEPVFQAKRMHVDGIQQIMTVQGWQVSLAPSLQDGDRTLLISNNHRDLAPKVITE